MGFTEDLLWKGPIEAIHGRYDALIQLGDQIASIGLVPGQTIRDPVFAQKIQDVTIGFVPLRSLQKLGREDLTGEDMLLLSLFFLPGLGQLGRGARAVGTGISATFRATVPLTARTFGAVRVYLAVVFRGNAAIGSRWFVRRMGQLFGPGGARVAAKLFRNFARDMEGAPIFAQIYIGTRLVVLERLITFAARSVPTQAAFYIALVQRRLAVMLYDAVKGLVPSIEWDSLLAMGFKIVLPEMVLSDIGEAPVEEAFKLGEEVFAEIEEEIQEVPPARRKAPEREGTQRGVEGAKAEGTPHGGGKPRRRRKKSRKRRR